MSRCCGVPLLLPKFFQTVWLGSHYHSSVKFTERQCDTTVVCTYNATPYPQPDPPSLCTPPLPPPTPRFRRHLIRPTLRQQLLSSCFSCLEVIADAAAAEGDSSAAVDALHKCLTAAAAVTPGSDLHCILAAKLEAEARAGSSGGSSGGSSVSSSMLAAAVQACAAAHEARYGPLTQQQLQRLAELNRTLYV